MPRYSKQLDRFRCGPVVIANTLKWAGVKPIPSLDVLTKKCKCRYFQGGTKRRHFHKALKQIVEQTGITTKFRVRSTYQEIKQHLGSGGCAIINYVITEKNHYTQRHFFLLIMTEHGKFHGINLFRGCTDTELTPEKLKDEIFHKGHRTAAWLVSKKD